MVAEDGSCWRVANFGQRELAQDLSDVRTAKVNGTSTGPGAEPEQYYDIRVQTMNLDFLAINETTNGPGARPDVQITPLTHPLAAGSAELPHTVPGVGQISSSVISLHDPSFGKARIYLKKNPTFTPEGKASRPASDVFDVLAPAAKKLEQTNGPT